MQSHLPEFDLLVPRSSTVLLEFIGSLGVNARLSQVSIGERGTHTMHICTQLENEPNSVVSVIKKL